VEVRLKKAIKKIEYCVFFRTFNKQR
jgi:hypothetical protein